MLWGRAAGRCSKCRTDLYEDETETDDPTLIGENCHIVAESDDGPRANPEMPLERRNNYGNLILLCRNDHRIIDTQPGEYTIERLYQMKADHEAWVRQNLGLDEAKQRDDEQYAAIVDEWEKSAQLGNWTAWSSHVLGGDHPTMWKELDADLYALRERLLTRVWPGRYPDLENAFHNFRFVLQDFQETFRGQAESRGGDETLMTRRFYKIDEWNPERYSRLLQQYEYHVALVSDLMLELTRAANLICDRVRQHLKHSYRLNEGRLAVESGPYEDLSFKKWVVQYSQEERQKAIPYPGLQSFLTERAKRDRSFGDGPAPDAS